MEALNIPGFQHLSWFLSYHTELPELYYFLMALMLGQSVKTIPNEKKVNIFKISLNINMCDICYELYVYISFS